MQVTINLPDDLARQLEPEQGRLVEIIRRGLARSGSHLGAPVAEVFEFLAGGPTPEELIAFQASEASNRRLGELLDASRSGTLSAAGETELDTLESLNDFVALLKLQARERLGQPA